MIGAVGQAPDTQEERVEKEGGALDALNNCLLEAKEELNETMKLLEVMIDEDLSASTVKKLLLIMYDNLFRMKYRWLELAFEELKRLRGVSE